MGSPVIGGLIAIPEGYPQPSQPGGIKTPVVPAQPPAQEPELPTVPIFVGAPTAESATRFHPDCGHHIMSWEVVYATVNGAPAALLCCPRCRFVQNIYQPPSLLDQQDILIG